MKCEYAITTCIIDQCLSECTACIIRLPVPSIRVARSLIGGRSGRLIDSQYQGGNTIAAERVDKAINICTAISIRLCRPLICVAGSMTNS